VITKHKGDNMKTKPIFKTGSSPSYKGYNREVYMSEYVTIPKARHRRLIITEVIAWGMSAFILLMTLIR
jgi:uncharacterized membrane protein (GlpM family)